MSHPHLQNTIQYLKQKKNILLLTTSTRWVGEKQGEKAKSTRLAYNIKNLLPGQQVTIMEVPLLTIRPCEGNVSTDSGNTCGLHKAALQDAEKNPTGNHRCWASINNPEDELWKISKALFVSDAVIFFGSVRWGQINAEYQKLIERLTWLENRHSTLGEENILGNIDAGVIVVGQNWRGKEVVDVQKQVLQFFGFQVPQELSWNWQYLQDMNNETNESYIEGIRAFERDVLQ